MELSSSCCTDINIHIDLRRVSQGISVDSSRKSSHLYCMLWNTGKLWSKWGENGLHLVLISAPPSYFALMSWHQRSSRLVTVFLGTLWCSINKIEAPDVFNWEYDIALHKMQGKSSLFSQGGGCVMGFLELRQERGVYSRVTAGMAIRNSTLFSEARTLV